jgi:hypothetical protein
MRQTLCSTFVRCSLIRTLGGSLGQSSQFKLLKAAAPLLLYAGLAVLCHKT